MSVTADPTLPPAGVTVPADLLELINEVEIVIVGLGKAADRICPDGIRDLLTAWGWKPESDRPGTVTEWWQHADTRVLVPCDPASTYYPQVIRNLTEAVADHHQAPQLAVLVYLRAFSALDTGTPADENTP